MAGWASLFSWGLCVAAFLRWEFLARPLPSDGPIDPPPLKMRPYFFSAAPPARRIFPLAEGEPGGKGSGPAPTSRPMGPRDGYAACTQLTAYGCCSAVRLFAPRRHGLARRTRSATFITTLSLFYAWISFALLCSASMYTRCMSFLILSSGAAIRGGS